MRIVPNNGVYFNRPLFCTKLFIVQSDCLSVSVLLEVVTLRSATIHFKLFCFKYVIG